MLEFFRVLHFIFPMKVFSTLTILLLLASCCSCPKPVVKHGLDSVSPAANSPQNSVESVKPKERLTPYRDNDEDYFYPLYYQDY